MTTAESSLLSSVDRDAHLRTDDLIDNLGHRTARGGAVTLFSQGTKFLFSMVSTVILARLLTPEDYGLIGMVAVITGFILVFKDLGLSAATIQKAEVSNQQISTLFWLNVFFSIGIMILTAVLAPAVAWFYGEPKLTTIMLAYSVGFLFSGLAVQHEALLRRRMRFTALALSEIVSLVVSIGIAIVLAWKGWRYWALVLSQLTLGMLYSLAVWIACRWRPGLPARNSGVRSMLAFGGNLTGFSVVNYFARNLDNLLIGRFWGPEQLGLYARAYQLLLLPIEQINTPITAVAIPALSRLKDSPERYRQAYLRLLEKVALLTMPGMVLMIACSDWIVRIILGPKWNGVSRIFALLGLVGLVQPIASTTGWLFVSQGRTRDMFKWGLLGSNLLILGIIAGLKWGAVGVAGSYSFVYLVIDTPLLFWYVGRTGPIRARDFYTTVAPIVAASICALLGCLAFRKWASLVNPITGIFSCFLICLVTTLAVLASISTGRSMLRDLVRSALLLLTPRQKSPTPSKVTWMNKIYRRLSWTLGFIGEWLPLMPFRSVLRLRDYEVRNNRGNISEGKTLRLYLRSPVRSEIRLRETGSDILTFNEVMKQQVYKDVLTYLSRCEAIVDLGANIGLASLYFADYFPNCRILAVEPNHSSYDLLTSNLARLIAAGRCRCLNVAVWSSETSLVPDDSFEPGHYSAFATKEVPIEADHTNGMIGLPITKILADSGFERIDLLKVDIEGAEIELFKGNLDWLRLVGAIAIEFHGDSREVCNFDVITASYGFRIIDEGGHTVIALKD